jgi:Fe-S cluster assembly protein SufB
MSRFAAKHATELDESLKDENYEHGFAYPTDHYSHILKPGLRKGVVEEISHIKQEPEWMQKLRMLAFEHFQQRPMPTWGADLSEINFDQIHYYLRPTDHAAKTWEDVPDEIKTTFDRLGIPEAERKYLAGVKMQYDSEVVYGSLKNVWEKDGVIFLSMDEGLAKYPDLVREYFGKLIPFGDNKFAALNTAVWSGGSFVYVPKGVHVKMPLQTYFRINSANAGQFERTLIIVDEGASVHYVEGCFVKGTKVEVENGLVAIEDVQKGEFVKTHLGRYCQVYHTQVRPYTGKLYTLQLRGDTGSKTQVTSEHPYLIVRRKRANERNTSWKQEWVPVSQIRTGDYACLPIDTTIQEHQTMVQQVLMGNGRYGFKVVPVELPSTKEFFRLVGYYLAEGSISTGHYLNFSFSEQEREYIDDVKRLLKVVFGEERVHESAHVQNHGISVVVRSTKLCRIFEQFGTSCDTKCIPDWMMKESLEKQKELVKGWFFGDGNYYKKIHAYGLEEAIRFCTTSEVLARQGRMLLARLGVASSLNTQDRSKQGRKTMFTLVVGGEYLSSCGGIVGILVEKRLNNKKRATYYHLDEKYLYTPIQILDCQEVKDLPVYNFSVEEDESYLVAGAAVHNCTAPSFSSSSLHSAVVEIFVKKGGRCQYTTVQNWYKTVYNLVTKRARVEEEGEMVWTDFNMGSKVTMKYPGFILAGKGAKGEVLSMALAGAGQHQDTGAKATHLAPYTSSTIISKSISKNGGRTSYRGLVHVTPMASQSKNTVICDALLLDPESRSDTYPTDRIMNSHVQIQHEATVSKIGEEQLFYLMSRGVTEETARKMIVNGFIDDIVKKLPLEYAVEMNRLIDHEMEGSIG